MDRNNSNQVTLNSETKDKFLHDFKIIRRNDIKVCDSKSDQRLYYFDKHVDFVVVTNFRSHVEPAHLHEENTEIYFMIQGKMLLNVEGEAICLHEGDMVIVNPGACHHFETSDDKVIFIAMKKEPGLDDKKLC